MKKILDHWYKEKRTKEERRNLYKKIRQAGIEASRAIRIRDWSDNHIALAIKTFGR